MAEALGQAATQAPHAMQAAASMAVSASSLATGTELASGADPVETEMKPPAAMIRSKADRFTTKSLITAKARARHGSMVMVEASTKCRMRNWQAGDARPGPGAMPLIIIP